MQRHADNNIWRRIANVLSQSKVTHATTEKLNSLELLARAIFEDSSKFEPSRKILSFLQKDVFCDLLCKFTVY